MKTLVNEDSFLLKQIMSDQDQFAPFLETVRRTYEEIGQGSFSNDILNGIQGDYKQFINAIGESMLAQLNDDYASLGPKQRQLEIETAMMVLNSFRQAVQRLVAFSPYTGSRTASLQLENISFEAGEFKITDVQHDIIADEFCREYLDGSYQEFWDDIQAVINVYSKTTAQMKKWGALPVRNTSLGELDIFIDRSALPFRPNLQSIKNLFRNK